MRGLLFFLLPLVVGAAVLGARSDNDECPGYKAINVKEHEYSLEADLVLNDWSCNSYGTDLQNLKLLVEYETGTCHPSLRRVVFISPLLSFIPYTPSTC